MAPVFPLSCARAHRLQRLRTRINVLHTDIFLPRHIIIQHEITIVSLTIHFSDTNTARFFDLHLILDTKTTPAFGWRPFFLFLFGLYLISDTKSAVDFEHKTLGEFPEKVRTRQNFCAQRAQKFRRNIEWPPARLENWLSQNQTDWRPNLKVFFTDFSLKTKKKKKGLHLKPKVFCLEFSLRDFLEFLFTFMTKIGIFSSKVTQSPP